MKKTKIVSIAACSALALFACDQGLSVSEKNEASSAIRASNDVCYPDGHYDLYFRNGAHVHNDCDGYRSEPHGKTIIDEYWQSDIKKWDKLLTGAGIPHQTYKTGKAGKYCNVTFDSDLLYGIGFEGRGFGSNGEKESGQFDILTKAGKKLKFGGTAHSHYAVGAYFAPAHGKFYFDEITHKQDEAVFNIEQKDCDHAKLLIEIPSGYKVMDKVNSMVKELKDAGANVIGTKVIPGIIFDDYYVVVAASSIDWFAIGR